jgi:hypothetical protein
MFIHDVYDAQLRKLGNGLALYEPDPGRDYEVRVGDVGHMKMGGFKRLFNILCEEGHTINHRGVPKDFGPLLSNREREMNERRLAAGLMCSGTVRHRRKEVEASTSAMCVQGPSESWHNF